MNSTSFPGPDLPRRPTDPITPDEEVRAIRRAGGEAGDAWAEFWRLAAEWYAAKDAGGEER